MTNLGLNIGVLNGEVSSWQRCPQREAPLYFENDGKVLHRAATEIYIKIMQFLKNSRKTWSFLILLSKEV
jgi:hypothetical protein